jgi:aspartyl-tRNA(Asn)/glutamyl-tRNA(Gln) amidotransferase subunit C
MPLDEATVKKIAFLARIKVPEDELDHLAAELSQIIGWVEQLAEVDTGAITPMTVVADMTWPKRDDTVTDGGYAGKVLANAPEAKGSFYTVPKVVE